ncbi:MAG TPA: ATP-binding protein [Rhizomicrobium sp.]|nr:ATP-binding protein [Rhizomicrobium sp.]
MTGLPCSGKSTIAYGIAAALHWPVFSVDPVDSAMRRDGVDPDTAGQAAYSVCRSLAAEQLKIGLSVVIDAVNAHQDAREIWLELARQLATRLTLVECVCPDEELHRARVLSRIRNLPHYPELTWAIVEETKARYTPWEIDKLRLSTDEASASLIDRALDYIRGREET